jgi:DNA-binding LytR/AlgR family response regulator
MMKEQIAVCDDQDSARATVHAALERRMLARGVEARVVEYASAQAMLADVEEGYESFDLYFLDILMSGLSGMDAARRLRKLKVRAPVVFLTSSQDFAVESYEVEAAGYLVKPLDPDRLDQLLDRLLAEHMRKRIPLRCGRETRNVCLDEIAWMESCGNMVRLYLTDGSVLETRDKLTSLETMMADKRFLRCHQSYLVNMEQVDSIREDFQMRDGAVIPIRVRTRKQILERYHDWFVSNAIEEMPGGGLRV